MIAYQRWTLAILLLAGSMLAGCTGIPPLPAKLENTEVPTTPPGEITVAAAASMQFALNDLKKLFEDETGYRVNLVYGSSGQLVQQIENGAPYDLIAAANTEYVDRLARQDLVYPESVALYARGQIVLAVNRAAGVEATDLRDLLSEDIRHIAIANPEHAPYGLAAKQALQSTGIWDQVQDKIVYAENIRQALQYVQSGDAQAGFVALSEANVPEITWALVDGSLYEPLNQALGVLTTSKHPKIADLFADYMIGKEGQAILIQYGFSLPVTANLEQSIIRP